MSKKANADLSRITIAAMDVNGYSKEMITSRAELMGSISSKAVDSVKQLVPTINLDAIVTGSRDEGVSKLAESDYDIMMVYRNFLCVEHARLEREVIMIQTISTYSPPGYTKLNPLHIECDSIGTSLFGFACAYDLNRGKVFVSSTCMRNYIDHVMEPIISKFEWVKGEKREQTGPSVPSSVRFIIPNAANLELRTTEVDNVVAMPYLASTVLEVWKKRSRKWPSPRLCKEVSEMEGFVVPVGPSDSEEQNFEWRICFTTAEKILVSHLSSVQLKLYILLKMLFKTLIKPSCDLISSYMIKNIVLWVAEGNDSDMFTPDKLIDLLLHCLAFLRECLNCNFIPNYMIPCRNLLVGKGMPHDKTRMTAILTDLLKEGGCVVMRIETLRNYVIVIGQSPIAARRDLEVRNRVEKLIIQMSHIVSSKVPQTSMLQSTFFYDWWLKIISEPSILEMFLSLMELLNVDLFSMVIHPEQFLKLVYSFLS